MVDVLVVVVVFVVLVVVGVVCFGCVSGSDCGCSLVCSCDMLWLQL